MTINNILTESVYKEKTITINKIFKEYENFRNRKFGIDLRPYGIKNAVADFNNDSYSLEKKEI